MITSIEINNFRCFKQTKAKGFGQVNLFGGRNNAGKTALLEALLLMGEPSNQSIIQLLKNRKVGADFIKGEPQMAWDNFFYQQQKKSNILLNFSADSVEYKVEIKYKEVIDDILELEKNDEFDVIDLSENNAIKSSLYITTEINSVLQENIFIASRKDIIGTGNSHTIINTKYFPANFKYSPAHLASNFDKAKLAGIGLILLNAFNVIDPSIESVDTFSIKTPELYLKRANEKYLPLTMFGDAMTKVANLILTIVNKENSIVLIDEIENGIHHENHEEIWSFLISLCKQFNVQLFATSHSFEMITAFKNIAMQESNSKDCKYFEMARHCDTNNIIIQLIPLLSLEDKLINHSPVRGELASKLK